MSKLNKLTLRGFKSIKDATIDFGSMNVLIGANGAGKSSLVSFFRLLNEMVGERLQQFIAQNGRAQSLLYHGPKRTPQIHAELEFETNNGVSHYSARWFHAAGDTLVFAEEKLRFQRDGSNDIEKELSLGPGHFETAHTQILVSTQSSTLLDHFEPDDVIVVNRTENGSVFTRPDAEKLDAWLDEYSLGEVWEKNVIAGGPH